MAGSQRSARLARRLGLALFCASLAGCNMIDLGWSDAKISNMVPGGNVATGGLDCWVTFEFKAYPEGADPRDVRVRFTSIALASPAEFDWSFISQRDMLAAPKGGKFGSGHVKADHTTPDSPPPLGEPLKVRFPLRAKSVIENAPDTVYLEAELYWGGEKQDSMRRTIEHVYEGKPGSFL